MNKSLNDFNLSASYDPNGSGNFDSGNAETDHLGGGPFNFSLVDESWNLSDDYDLSGSGEFDSPNTKTDQTDIGVIIFLALVCTIGVIANLLVILVVLVLREYRKTLTHWYVLQLAIADCTFLLTIPFKLTEDVRDEWPFSSGMCKAKETVLFLNYFSSIMFLMVMSLDRYVAVCHANSNVLASLRSRKASYIITGIVWITALLFCIPIMAYSGKMGNNPNCKCRYQFPKDFAEICRDTGFSGSKLDDCIQKQLDRGICMDRNDTGLVDYLGDIFDNNETFEDTDEIHYASGCSYQDEGPGWFAYLNFMFIAMFVFPLLIMVVCYTFIIRRLIGTRYRTSSIMSHQGRRSSNTAGRGRTLSASSLKANRKITRVNITCITLVIIFLICWLPYHSVHMAISYGINKTSSYCLNLFEATSSLIFLNSALNPLVYNFIGTRFGKRLRNTIKRRGINNTSKRNRGKCNQTTSSIGPISQKRASRSIKVSMSGRRSSESSLGRGAVRYKAKRRSSSKSSSHALTIDSVLTKQRDGTNTSVRERLASTSGSQSN